MKQIDKIKEMANYCLNCKVKPCKNGCPLGNNIPDFIKCVKEEKFEEAYNILSETTILQPICGRICPHESQCQGKCVRGIKSTPVQIGELEAFVGDMAIKNNWKPEIEKSNGKNVAIVGGGPAGLTAAAFLKRKGFKVTIYEKYNKLGGLLRHGIPEFRLSKELLDTFITRILDLGIEVEYEKELGKNLSLEELRKNYGAVFLAFGANISKKMQIPGEELDGVYGGNELLENNLHPEYKGKKVAVIGGGNVAMDTARTVKRLGADEVYVLYRRSEKQMPAEKKEMDDAKKEEIKFKFLTNVVSIKGDLSGKVCEIECIDTKLVKKEGEDRDFPINVEDSNYFMDIDFVIMAVGSEPEEGLVKNLGLEINKWGYIDVDENYKTSLDNVFAGGDLAGTKSTVAWAARTGREAAYKIAEFLN